MALEAPAESPAATSEAPPPSGAFESEGGELWFRIRGVDRLPPFLIHLPTDTDLWMFVSSNGGLTAGRRDPDGALFPYETVDKLHEALHHTGPVTVLRVRRGGRPPIAWEPLALRDVPRPGAERSLLKNASGTRLVFEEVDDETGLAFRYRWAGSEETGWVRTATLENRGRERAVVSLLDGLRNLLPCGAPLRLHQQSSCLVDAYRRAELDERGLAIFSLTAKISDRPEPAEELRATTAWCAGLTEFRVALSREALAAFRRGEHARGERVLTGRRGSYLVAATLELEPGARAVWHLGIDTRRTHADVARLRARLRRGAGATAWIERSLASADESLRRIVGSADGLQLGARASADVHHYANTLFNVLRGGVFLRDHACPREDVREFLEARHRGLAARHAGILARLADEPTVEDLRRAAEGSGDPDLARLLHEYLPLHFGRRHGDPSRPWNRFSIDVRRPDGERALRYEGNWRDVFQNWEALALGFPGFLPSIVATFVNASTIDGFNPYRLTRDGVDWEVPDPADPWSGIGYWGDHQIVYLLRLLEPLRRHFPGGLEALLSREIFAYADVPYRLAPHAEIVAHPRSTIRYDRERAALVARRVAALGGDGKLVAAPDGSIHHASLLEKLLVTTLAKLGGFVPGGGIWMNTERPEWNDANNALAGTGVSVVTLCHLRRWLRFLEETLEGVPDLEAAVSSDVAAWMRRVAEILRSHPLTAEGRAVDDAARRRTLDELGGAFSDYRESVYARGPGARAPLAAAEALAFCREARAHVELSIRANRRPDGLYHSYHVLELSPDGARASLQPLGLMLEGQVAALSSGMVGAAEAADLLAALFESPLYRRDRNSFLLYPVKTLPGFRERNRIPEAVAARVPLIAELLAAGDASIVERDAEGALRFHADLGSARDLHAALDRLAARDAWPAAVARDREALAEAYEEVFHHRTFTGRSGTMYAYEGIGCVYWHLVAKLLLAVQEVALAANAEGAAAPVREALARHYHRIRGGLGFEKSVAEFGAFPTDPYSHTPAHGGAQQPGMTGQVKEEILTRFGELGVLVEGGRVEFAPALLRRDELLAAPATFSCFDRSGAARSIEVPAGALAFTYAQTPVVYHGTRGRSWIRVTGEDGSVAELPGRRLSAVQSRALLDRSGGIARIDVGVPEDSLFRG